MNKAEHERFKALRKKVMDAVRWELTQNDGYGKSYEGTFELIVGYPNYYEDEEATQGPDSYCIRLHCYVLGPARHYDWFGKTFGEALTKAEREIGSWIKEGTDVH